MRLPAALMLLTSLACGPTHAGARDSDIESSQQRASQVFWSFAKCAVERHPDASVQLLEIYAPTKAGFEAAADFAKKHSFCLLPGEKLRMDEQLFIGAIAGAYFIQRHEDSRLPDYAGVAPLLEVNSLRPDADSEQWRQGFLLIFGDCVFRKNSMVVLELLRTRPFSRQESAILSTLTPALGSCLPLDEGAQVRFTRIGLRSALGEVAYKVDSKVSQASVAALEVTQ